VSAFIVSFSPSYRTPRNFRAVSQAPSRLTHPLFSKFTDTPDSASNSPIISQMVDFSSAKINPSSAYMTTSAPPIRYWPFNLPSSVTQEIATVDSPHEVAAPWGTPRCLGKFCSGTSNIPSEISLFRSLCSCLQKSLCCRSSGRLDLIDSNAAHWSSWNFR